MAYNPRLTKDLVISLVTKTTYLEIAFQSRIIVTKFFAFTSKVCNFYFTWVFFVLQEEFKKIMESKYIKTKI